MANLTVVSGARAANNFDGVAASAGGDQFANTGHELLVVNNATALTPLTLTITTTMQIDGEAVDDKEIIVPPGERHLIGPFPPVVYNDAENKVSLGYSGVTDITVAVCRAP